MDGMVRRVVLSWRGGISVQVQSIECWMRTEDGVSTVQTSTPTPTIFVI